MRSTLLLCLSNGRYYDSVMLLLLVLCVAHVHINSAKAHVSRGMLERLREDVRWFAGDQNAKTAPELVGFSDSEVYQ
jgi:hypothetical protein